MTRKLTREWLQHQISAIEAVGITDSNTLAAFKLALAAMDSEPVAWRWRSGPNAWWQLASRGDIDGEVEPLYRHAQPALVIPSELHPDTQKLVTDFCTALADKLYKAQLKYGYDADWKQDGWPSQCKAHFHQHIAKGDPRDVAAYCAFMWYHGWKTEAAQPEPIVPDECPAGIRDLMASHSDALFNEDDTQEIWNACRAAMLSGGKS
ncbi:hypothetical protein ACKWWX_004306 [Klebsiella oxytoca]